MLLNGASALNRAFRGPSGAFREVPRTYADAAKHGGPSASRADALSYVAHPGAPGRPRKCRFNAEALLSNIVGGVTMLASLERPLERVSSA
jgi:hypothetical protein